MKSFKTSLLSLIVIILLSIVIKDNVKTGRDELISPIPLTRAKEEVIKDKQGQELFDVSWYDAIFDGFNCDDPECITASAERYDLQAFTTACPPEYQLGSRFAVSYGKKTIVVRCNDRGVFWKSEFGGRKLDLSREAFKTLAPLSRGVIKVNVELLK